MTELYDDYDEFRSYLDGLTSHISDLSEVLAAFCTPLHALSLLPKNYERYNIRPFKDISAACRLVLKRLPAIHSAFITHILPVWYPRLEQEGHAIPVLQLFTPEPFQSQHSGSVGLTAFSSLLSNPIRDFTVELLTELVKRYPTNVVFRLIFSRNSTFEHRTRIITWEEYIRYTSSIPAKISNWAGSNGGSKIPKELESGDYFKRMCRQTEQLIWDATGVPEVTAQNIGSLLSKLVTLGLFTTAPSAALSHSQASFFVETLPALREHLKSTVQNSADWRKNTIWPSVLRTLSRSQRANVAKSLIANLDKVADSETLSESIKIKHVVILDAITLRHILGGFDDGDDNEGDLWDIVNAAMLAQRWDVFHARVFVCWIANCGDVTESNVSALETFLDKILELWGDPTYVRHSTLAEHKYLTTLLLLTLSTVKCISLGDGPSLHFNPTFIRGISHYLSHLDPAVRRCGMLAAEVASQQTGKDLSFGGWDDDQSDERGSGDWKVWARELRELVKSEKRDWDVDQSKLFEDSSDEPVSQPSVGVVWEFTNNSPKAAVISAPDSDDDSLVGYDSDDEVTRSRTPSPTQSELDEIEHDPTIHVGRKRIRPPVYLVDLGAMLREKYDVRGEEPNNKGGDDKAEEKAEAIKIALEHAEGMIRRRRTFGTELDECAVDLVHALIAIKNNFDLEGFDEQRQSALVALVACAPRKAPPAIAEELFKNQYSVDQRYVMLNALALGARELAGLPTEHTRNNEQGRLPLFPSKMLPQGIHSRYVDEERKSGALALLAENIQKMALEGNSARLDVDRPRERRLRNAPNASGRIAEIQPGAETQITKGSQSPYDKPMESFASVAVEYFLGPLMGRFWNFVRDEQTREQRSSLSASSDANTRYRAAGTGLVLSPLVLSHLLRTVSVLVHASRHSLLFMAIVVPDALEMAVVLGTRPVSAWNSHDPNEREQEAAILHSSLELALITLDACISIDSGRILAMDYTALVLGVEEWAMRVVQELDKGIKFSGAGGALTEKISRVAAGVVVKIDEAIGNWRRVMPVIGT